MELIGKAAGGGRVSTLLLTLLGQLLRRLASKNFNCGFGGDVCSVDVVVVLLVVLGRPDDAGVLSGCSTSVGFAALGISSLLILMRVSARVLRSSPFKEDFLETQDYFDYL